MAKKANGHELQHAAEQFLYRQSELLDSRKWQEWIDLFSNDGIYWMPPDASYKTWDGQPAIFAEDKNLMTVRMNRVLHPDAWSQRPLWETNHVVSNVVVDKVSPNGDVVVKSRFHMMELRRVLVKAADDDPAGEHALRDAFTTMLLAGIAPDFRLALVAATQRVEARYRSVQRDLSLASVHAKIFENESDAAYWLNGSGGHGARAAA